MAECKLWGRGGGGWRGCGGQAVAGRRPADREQKARCTPLCRSVALQHLACRAFCRVARSGGVIG